MQLLIRRSQDETTFLRLPIFKLWAKFDCTPEESVLITKYQVANNLLTLGKPGEVKRAGIRAVIFAVIFTVGLIILANYLGYVIAPFALPQIAITIWLISFIFSWFFIYHQIRESIRIDDIAVLYKL
jgi:hypothetical protein